VRFYARFTISGKFIYLAAITDVSITNRDHAYGALASFITGTRVIPQLTHIRKSQRVATDRSPVITHHVAYALCSKNVVRVNEAKLHTEVSCTKDILCGSPTDPHRLLFCSFYLRSRFSQSIASNCSPEVTLTFPRTYVRTKNL